MGKQKREGVDSLLGRVEAYLAQAREKELREGKQAELDGLLSSIREHRAIKPSQSSGVIKDWASLLVVDQYRFVAQFPMTDERSAKAAEQVCCLICEKPARGARLRRIGKVRGKAGCAEFVVSGVEHVGCAMKRNAEQEAAWNAERESYFNKEQMMFCACGHGSGAHKEEVATGNLMKCEATGCKCDHFHYEAPKAEPVIEAKASSKYWNTPQVGKGICEACGCHKTDVPCLRKAA